MSTHRISVPVRNPEPDPDDHFDFDGAGEWLLAAVNITVVRSMSGGSTAPIPRSCRGHRSMAGPGPRSTRCSESFAVSWSWARTARTSSPPITTSSTASARPHVLDVQRPSRTWWYLRHLHSIVSYLSGRISRPGPRSGQGGSFEDTTRDPGAPRGPQGLPVHVHGNRPLPALSEMIQLDPVVGDRRQSILIATGA